MKITGWIGAQTHGYCDEFKATIRQFNRHSHRLAFADVFIEMAKSRRLWILRRPVLSAAWVPDVDDYGHVPDMWCH